VSEGSECALGILGDGVPPAFLDQGGLATLAARRRACVAAALATASLAWEVVSIHILAADITLGHTDIAAATITASAQELRPLAICASGGRILSSARECALGILGDGVPLALVHEGGFATLAARRRASVATALAAVSLAWEVVSIHVLAAEIAHPHTDVAAATITASALELVPLSIPAHTGWQSPPCFRILVTAHSQERTLLASTLAICRALLSKRHRRAPEEHGNRKDSPRCHPQDRKVRFAFAEAQQVCLGKA